MRVPITIVAAGLLAAAAHAQTPDALYVRSLAGNCAHCHGTDGRAAAGAPLAPLAPLAGMPRDHLVTQLKAFKAGTRPSTIMTQIAKGYSDAQIEQLASFFAAQK